MRHRWTIVLLTAVLWLVGSARVEGETVKLSFNPPVNKPIQITVDSNTKVVEGSTSAPRWTESYRTSHEWTFSRKDGQWHITTTVKSYTNTLNGQNVQDRFWEMDRNQPTTLRLDEHGQAVHVPGLEGRVEQIRVAAAASGMAAAAISPEVIQAGTLHNWNAAYGIVWSIVTGREMQLDTPIAFQAQLHVDLSLSRYPLLTIEPVAVSGQVQVSSMPTGGPQARYVITCEYQREEALDESQRARLVTALSKALPSPAAGSWSMSQLTVKSETTVDAATLMLVEERVEQRLIVRGESGASFRVENESRRRATWPQ